MATSHSIFSFPSVPLTLYFINIHFFCQLKNLMFAIFGEIEIVICIGANQFGREKTRSVIMLGHSKRNSKEIVTFHPFAKAYAMDGNETRHLLNRRASRIPQYCRFFDFSSYSSQSLRNRINFKRFCIASGLFGGGWMTCVAIVIPFMEDGLRLCPFRWYVTVVWCCCCDWGCIQLMGFGEETTVVSNFKWRTSSTDPFAFLSLISPSSQSLHASVCCLESPFSHDCAISTVGSISSFGRLNSLRYCFLTHNSVEQ